MVQSKQVAEGKPGVLEKGWRKRRSSASGDQICTQLGKVGIVLS